MKTFIKPLALLIILFTAACLKEKQPVVNAALAGKWKLNATYADPGDGSGTYRPVVDTGNNSITFTTDGKLQVSGLKTQDNFLLSFSQYSSYTVKDTTTLIFKKQADTTTQKFLYRIKGDQLSLIPAGPVMCIEGCGTRFVKVGI